MEIVGPPRLLTWQNVVSRVLLCTSVYELLLYCCCVFIVDNLMANSSSVAKDTITPMEAGSGELEIIVTPNLINSANTANCFQG